MNTKPLISIDEVRGLLGWPTAARPLLWLLFAVLGWHRLNRVYARYADRQGIPYVVTAEPDGGWHAKRLADGAFASHADIPALIAWLTRRGAGPRRSGPPGGPPSAPASCASPPAPRARPWRSPAASDCRSGAPGAGRAGSRAPS